MGQFLECQFFQAVISGKQVLIQLKYYPFPKMEDAMRQRCLIPPESIPPRARYEKLFENLPPVPSKHTGRGRPPVSREVLLKGLIYRNLRGIHKLVV